MKKYKNMGLRFLIIILFLISWVAFILLPYPGISRLLNSAIAAALLTIDLLLGNVLSKIEK